MFISLLILGQILLNTKHFVSYWKKSHHDIRYPACRSFQETTTSQPASWKMGVESRRDRTCIMRDVCLCDFWTLRVTISCTAYIFFSILDVEGRPLLLISATELVFISFTWQFLMVFASAEAIRFSILYHHLCITHCHTSYWNAIIWVPDGKAWGSMTSCITILIVVIKHNVFVSWRLIKY